VVTARRRGGTGGESGRIGHRAGIFGGVCHLPRFTKHTNLRTPFESEVRLKHLAICLGLWNWKSAHLPASTIWIIVQTPPTPWHGGARNVGPGYHIRPQPLLNGTMHKRRYQVQHCTVSIDKKWNCQPPKSFPECSMALGPSPENLSSHGGPLNNFHRPAIAYKLPQEQSRIAKSPILLLRSPPIPITQKNKLRACGNAIRVCWRWEIVPFGP
jgi:hypothetical protein